MIAVFIQEIRYSKCSLFSLNEYIINGILRSLSGLNTSERNESCPLAPSTPASFVVIVCSKFHPTLIHLQVVAYNMAPKLQSTSFVFDAPWVRHLEEYASPFPSSSSSSTDSSQGYYASAPCLPALKMTAKQYTSGFSSDNALGLTLLFAHGVGARTSDVPRFTSVRWSKSNNR